MQEISYETNKNKLLENFQEQDCLSEIKEDARKMNATVEVAEDNKNVIFVEY